jgi:hypothetical protein
VKPILQALLLADRVYEDKATNKKIVAGIFHQITFVSQGEVQKAIESQGTVPVPHAGFQSGSPFGYVSLTEIHGEQLFTLRYVDLDDNTVLFKLDFKINSKDPLQIIDLGIPLPPLPATKSGVFALELLLQDGHPLGSCRIIVKEAKLNKGEGEQ